MFYLKPMQFPAQRSASPGEVASACLNLMENEYMRALQNSSDDWVCRPTSGSYAL